MVGKRAVRILLECFLVTFEFARSEWALKQSNNASEYHIRCTISLIKFHLWKWKWIVVHVDYWIRFEWNKNRCTYVHWRIYSSRDLDTLLHRLKMKIWMITLENTLAFIQSQQWKRNVRIALRSQLTEENWENYNDMRNCHLSEPLCEVSFHCLLCA